MSKQIFFVLVDKDCSKEIEASTKKEALIKFQSKDNNVIVYGPFYKKKVYEYRYLDNVIFSGKSIKCKFKGWIVNAFLLKDPEDHAYLLFSKKIDENGWEEPKNKIVVDISLLEKIC